MDSPGDLLECSTESVPVSSPVRNRTGSLKESPGSDTAVDRNGPTAEKQVRGVLLKCNLHLED